MTEMVGWSEGRNELVAAAKILDERVAGGQDPRGPVALRAAHRPQPGLQPVGLDSSIWLVDLPGLDHP